MLPQLIAMTRNEKTTIKKLQNSDSEIPGGLCDAAVAEDFFPPIAAVAYN